MTYTIAGNVSTQTSQLISSEITSTLNSTCTTKKLLSDLLIERTPDIFGIHNSASEKVLPKAKLLTSADFYRKQTKPLKKKQK